VLTFVQTCGVCLALFLGVSQVIARYYSYTDKEMHSMTLAVRLPSPHTAERMLEAVHSVEYVKSFIS